MTTPKSDTARGASTNATADKKSSKQTMGPADAARAELHGAGFGGVTIMSALGDDLFKQWADAVKTDPRYHLADPDNPRDERRATNSSGSNPPPAIILQYGDGTNDYVSTVFDAGQVIVQDANDPTGRALKFPESGWRRFVARVRGEELPPDPANDGPSQYEEAAALQKRTNESIQADRDATDRAAQRNADRQA
jgi:Domain of unknown function (DUF397)